MRSSGLDKLHDSTFVNNTDQVTADLNILYMPDSSLQFHFPKKEFEELRNSFLHELDFSLFKDIVSL